MGRILGLLGMIVIGFAGVLVGPAAPACACSCMPMEEAEYERLADVIFEGSAVRIDDFRGGGEADAARVRITFEVTGVSKGDIAGTAHVVTYRDGATCGAELQAGHRYRVYARSEGDLLTTNLCAGNKDLGAGGPIKTTPTNNSTSYYPAVAIGGGFALAAVGLLWYLRRRRHAS
jgi:hypothetical protein